MLSKLYIQNYAIIDELEIGFSDRLNAITGETGAGKSIIVGALGLILGNRADSSVLVNKERKCFVEGVFDVKNKKQIKALLEHNDLEPTDELIIRREINNNGKSRAFVNDTPVTLSQLGQLSSLLVDLHQQFDTLQLNDNDFHKQVLDALAARFELLNDYNRAYRSWQRLSKQLEDLRQQKQQFEKEFDYNKFQYDELHEANFKENELEDLEQQLKILSNSEGIKAALLKTYEELKEGNAPIVQRLKTMLNQLQPFSAFHTQLPSLTDRIQSAQIELQDIANDIDRMSEQINYDPEKIERINERLSVGYRLLKKHGVKNTDGLLQIQQQLQQKLQSVLNIDEQLINIENRVSESCDNALRLASEISANRRRQIKPLEEKVNNLLAQVGMPNARLQVLMETTNVLSEDGVDAVQFLFDANRSGQFHAIRKIASGGELSRLMLCIKSLVAASIDLPTMIFDEIDTGISGEAARQVGIIMKGLADNRQVICITHQPQIAGKADAHFLVFKEIVGENVKTNIRRLEAEERIIAIARMLSGERPTAAAIENAREMVAN